MKQLIILKRILEKLFNRLLVLALLKRNKLVTNKLCSFHTGQKNKM